MQDSMHSSLWGSQRGCSPVWLLAQPPQATVYLLQAVQEQEQHVIHQLLILQPALLAFPLLPPAFSICGTYYSISSPGLFLSLSCLLLPPQPPSLLFSLLSTSDPHPITPAGSSSPGTHQECETDALDQQGATAQHQPPAGSQLSCPSFPSGELKP